MAFPVIQEIQGLRGIAILSIFLFHLWPKVFPNGYAGNDIFIVVSGYLIARSLSIRPNYSARYLGEFYFKRAKRIIPLYYVILPVILMVSWPIIGIAWLETTFEGYTSAALYKMSAIWNREDCFSSSNINTKDVYKHLWSTLEVQFYLVSPLIILLLGVLKKKGLKITFLLLTCSLSFRIYCITNQIYSLNYFPGRFWQFGLGIMAFITSNEEIVEGEPISVSASIYSTCLSVIAEATLSSLVMVGAQEIGEIVIRPLITLSCFVLLIVQAPTTKKILSSKLLTYMGDISYSLHLVHWPTIFLLGPKYCPLTIIGVILAFSIFCHEYIEKKHKNLSLPKTFIVFAGVVLLNLTVYLAFLRCPVIRNSIKNYYYQKVPKNVREAIANNLQFDSNKTILPSGAWNISTPSIHSHFNQLQIWDYTKGQGSLKVAILGDTYALNQMDLIIDEIRWNQIQVKVVVGEGLTGLFDSWDKDGGSNYVGQYEAAFGEIEKFNPDILFLVSRFWHRLPPVQSLGYRRSLVQVINKNIANLEKFCGKIFVHGLIRSSRRGHLKDFIDDLFAGKDLTAFNLDKLIVDHHYIEPYNPHQHYQLLLDSIQCAKCRIYDIGSSFLESERYLTYDPENNLSYFDNSGHLTFAGLDRIRFSGSVMDTKIKESETKFFSNLLALRIICKKAKQILVNFGIDQFFTGTTVWTEHNRLFVQHL